MTPKTHIAFLLVAWAASACAPTVPRFGAVRTVVPRRPPSDLKITVGGRGPDGDGSVYTLQSDGDLVLQDYSDGRGTRSVACVVEESDIALLWGAIQATATRKRKCHFIFDAESQELSIHANQRRFLIEDCEPRSLPNRMFWHLVFNCGHMHRGKPTKAFVDTESPNR